MLSQFTTQNMFWVAPSHVYPSRYAYSMLCRSYFWALCSFMRGFQGKEHVPQSVRAGICLIWLASTKRQINLYPHTVEFDLNEPVTHFKVAACQLTTTAVTVDAQRQLLIIHFREAVHTIHWSTKHMHTQSQVIFSPLQTYKGSPRMIIIVWGLKRISLIFFQVLDRNKCAELDLNMQCFVWRTLTAKLIKDNMDLRKW